MANSWGESGTTWGQGDWGQQDVFTIHPTGYSIAASLGEALSYPEEGWGRFAWSQMGWGDDSNTVYPTGLAMTGSMGTLVAASEQGWGRATWGNEPWGDSNSPVVALSGYSITGTLGTLAYAQSEEGWGRDEWGIGNWGENTTTIADITGFEMSGHMGPDGWGEISFGNSAWGGQPFILNTVADVVGSFTGLEATGSLGTPQLNYDFKHVLTQSLLGTVARGSLSINNGADHTQGLGGQAITGNVGAIAPADVVGLSGLTGTMTLAAPATGDVQRVSPSGLGATANLGTLPTLSDMSIGLSGLQATGSLGTLTITDMSIGLTGYLITGSLGSSGVAPLGYKDIDITGNTSYTYVEHSA